MIKRESKPCVSTLAVHILNINCTRERALPTCLATAYNHKYSESHLTKLSKEAKLRKNFQLITFDLILRRNLGAT